MTDEIPKIEIIDKKNFSKIKNRKITRYLNLLLHPSQLLNKIFNKFYNSDKMKDRSSFDYKELYLQHGRNAVIDHRHPYDQFEYVTKKQKEILYPILKSQINEPITKILDFGCGIGRFSGDLAEMFDCNVMGVDTSKHLIDLCNNVKNVNYFVVDEKLNQIKDKFDLIFICNVINGIPDQKVFQLAEILSNLLNKSGKLFLVEITGKKNIENIWRTRTANKIIDFFPKIDLRHISQYIDIDNEVSIFFGQKIN